jgi:ribosomal protein S18 acetylase RimI-like enzyme
VSLGGINISFQLWLSFNKGKRFLFYILERIGITFRKSIFYVKDLEKFEPTEIKNPDKSSLIIRLCTIDDFDKFPKEEKLDFKKDIEKGHNMLTAFLNGKIVSYTWLSFQKVYAKEIEQWVDIDGGYLWQGFTLKKYRGKGFGKKLLYYAFQIVKEQSKVKKLYTLTLSTNVISQKILKSVGFEREKSVIYYNFFNLKKGHINRP